MPALLNIAGIDVTRDIDGSIRYVAGLALDSDGSPHSYAPPPLHGLDYLANAKDEDGHWVGIACDSRGRPFVQDDSDPAPGYYVSTTSLEDDSYERNDPRRYVDSETIPYIVVPGSKFAPYGVRLGDSATVRNLKNGASVDAIVGDTGPRNKLGEGSIALAHALGINSDPRKGGTDARVVEYRIHPGKPSPLFPIS